MIGEEFTLPGHVVMSGSSGERIGGGKSINNYNLSQVLRRYAVFLHPTQKMIFL